MALDGELDKAGLMKVLATRGRVFFQVGWRILHILVKMHLEGGYTS